MEDHWHIYWQNPGDAGLEPDIEWVLPPDFKIGEIIWPYPQKIMVGGLANFGYEGEVLLMAEVLPPNSIPGDSQIELKAQVEWLVCKEECIPGEASLSFTLPVSLQPPMPDDRWIEKFSNARTDHPLKITDWKISAFIRESFLILDMVKPDWDKSAIKEVTFFPIEEGILENAAEQVLKSVSTGYQLEILLNNMILTIPDSISGVLVTDQGWRGRNSEKALWINTNLASGQATDVGAFAEIILALVFAFFGGIILNIMPCVLPVLSLKILSFVQQAGEDRRKIVVHGIVFTAGVILSFLFLAALLIILRTGGEELGWGFQLQSPGFIMILSAFLFLFGLNLFGLFELGTSVMGIGQSMVSKGGWLGSFMSGVTATVVATPCTAPFMGSALGFALTQPDHVSLLIFASLGFGMAFPYLLLTLIPGLLKFIPKPGQWMESLKQFMGFLLFATVIWLIWVFGLQTNMDSVAILLAVLLGTGISAWIIGRWTQLHLAKSRRIIARIVALSIIFISMYAGFSNISIIEGASQVSENNGRINWENYSHEKVELALQKGHPVFIDFTAAWCLSCQVNERIAFSSGEVQAKLKELNFVMLKADWTNRDEKITRALAMYGRNSVPLYVIHNDADLSKKMILPEILSASIVLNAIENVKDEHSDKNNK